MTARSFTISGLDCFIKNYPTIRVIPSITWDKSASGFPFGSDRGAGQDIYEADVVFYDTESNINTLQSTLNSNRNSVTMSNFGDLLFTPYVDHSGGIIATIMTLGERVYTSFASPSTGMYELTATFRAVSPPTIVSVTPSLSSLRVQPGFTADKDYTSDKIFTYNQTVSYADMNSDSGDYVGNFLQTTNEMRAIMLFLLANIRAASFPFPSIGVPYPFGAIIGSSGIRCKATSIKISRRDFIFWNLALTLEQAI